MPAAILAAFAAALTLGRFFVPTVGHSMPMLAFAGVEIALGAVLALLWFWLADNRRAPWMIVLAVLLVFARVSLPAPAYPGPLWFIGLAHLYVGVMLVLLWLRRGRWPLGWACLLVPSLTEAALFAAHHG